MRLVDGADAIRGDLPSASTRIVEIPLEAGDDQGTGVARLRLRWRWCVHEWPSSC